MRASPITTTGANTTFLNTNISPLVVFVTTIATLIIAVFKKRTVAVTAVIIDRIASDISGRAKVLFANASDFASLDTLGLAENVELFQLQGKKQAGTSQMQWGIGSVTPDLIDSTLTTAFNGLNFTSGLLNGTVDLVTELKALVLPEIGSVAPRTGLEKILDLLPLIRPIAALQLGLDTNPMRLVVTMSQTETTCDIIFRAVGEPDLAAVEAIPTFFVVDEINAPETAALSAATPRLAME